MNYLRVPLAIDFEIGKKIQFIVGAGAYTSYLLNFDGIYNSNFNNSYNRFQIGVNLNTGIGYQFNEKLNFRVLYQYNIDVTPMYSELVYSHAASNYQNVYGIDGFVKLSIKYDVFTR
jgi:hypothetical protein